MTKIQGIAVTYTGRDDPFIDRIYRSGLTFTNGQSRTVPPTLAERFLRHADVFERTKGSAELTADVSNGATKAPPNEVLSKDDTQQLLDAAQNNQDARRVEEEARFALLDQIDSMDKPALITWAQDKFKQKIPGNLGEAKVRERVKAFVDQYGMP